MADYIQPDSDLERKLLLECIAHRLIHTSRQSWYWSVAPEVAAGTRGFAEDGSLPGLVTFSPADESFGQAWALVLHLRFRAFWQQHAVEVEWRLVEDEVARRACDWLPQWGPSRNAPVLRYELRTVLSRGVSEASSP